MNKSTPRGGGWRRLLFCIAVATCSQAASAQAVFKCQEGGQTVFKDQPCAGSQGTVAEDIARRKQTKQAEAAEPQGGGQALVRVANTPAAQEEARRERQAACGPQMSAAPAVGMKAEWVERCSAWLRPDKVNAITTARGTRAQWVYERLGYLYINEDGIVTAIQTTTR